MKSGRHSGKQSDTNSGLRPGNPPNKVAANPSSTPSKPMPKPKAPSGGERGAAIVPVATEVSTPVSQTKIPKKYQPRGYEILFEDRDIIVGNKSPGFVTVEAKWSQGDSIHDAVNSYVRKGNSRSRVCSYVVHRLDQATSGILIFAKTEAAQFTLKENWATNEKIYLAIVHGQLEKKAGTISSYLTEDEKYFVTSNQKMQGKFAQTEYKVIRENANFSLVEIRLLTGRKNQIRVHFADNKNPLVGDAKYGNPNTKHKNLALHARSIEFNHPHSGKRIKFEAPVPEYFSKILI